MSIQFNNSTLESNNQNERTEPTLTTAQLGIEVAAKKRQTCCGWV